MKRNNDDKGSFIYFISKKKYTFFIYNKNKEWFV